MSGERGIAVNRRTLFQKHHNRDLPSLFTKLPVRVLLLSVFCAMMSILCFQFLMQWEQWFYLQLVKRGMMFSFQPEKIMEEIQEKAKDICFYEVDRQELIELLELDKYDDGYTYFSFYDGDNGGFQFYIFLPDYFGDLGFSSFWYDGGYYGPDIMEYIEFKDTTEQVFVYSMHLAKMTVPYFFTVLFISMLMLLPVPIYIGNRMRYAIRMKDEVLAMAEGDLEHPITVKGRDELRILAENLDQMRLAFDENIRKELEGKKANQELIRSISHDLRTPLTTLYGYLEIMGQTKCSQEKQKDYLARCIGKVEEIRILSDKMFEYALVYGQEEETKLTEIHLGELLEELEQNREFLELKGFSVQLDIKAEEGIICGNAVLFQRIFSNLFTNILKYANRGSSVTWSVAVDKGTVRFVFGNQKGTQKNVVESNGIGLRSVRRITELQGGSFFLFQDQEQFVVTLEFPLC